MRHYQVISADGHIEFPLDFQTRVPQKHKDLVPKLVRQPDGSEIWEMAGRWRQNSVGNLFCGLRYDEFTRETSGRYYLPDGSPRPGTGTAVQRLREQDVDGVDAECLYPPVHVGAFARKLMALDAQAYLSIVQAYNTFLATEYCSLAPDRLIGNAMIPASGVDDAVAEMERCRKMGLIAACPIAWPNGDDGPKPEDDRFWAAALDMDMKIAPHGDFGGAMPKKLASPNAPVAGDPAPHLTSIALAGRTVLGPGGTIGKLIESGVFDRFPKMKIYFAETHAGWLPYQMAGKLDEFYLRWFTFFRLPRRKMPSQYYRDNCIFSFIQDRTAMAFRHYIGVDNLMWGTDFPHSETTFPQSKRALEELFWDVPERERRKVLLENPCKFFGLDPEQELTPTPQ